MGILLLIALSVASTVALVVSDPAKLNVGRFQRISTFLEVVVGLLLGFFLSSSVQRWYNCTNGFLELFDAIRSLHMQLNALGVPKERVRLCLRYCVVSAHCLDNDLIAAAMSPEDRAAFLQNQWETIATDAEDGSVFTDKSKSFATLLANEREILAKIDDPAQTLWVWVTSLLTRMSADGEIPPIPTPTYGRIITIAEQAYGGIRTVRASIRVQPPFVHVQMMAALVLVNNIINAVSFGMSAGVTVSMCLARYHVGPHTSSTPGLACFGVCFFSHCCTSSRLLHLLPLELEWRRFRGRFPQPSRLDCQLDLVDCGTLPVPGTFLRDQGSAVHAPKMSRILSFCF